MQTHDSQSRSPSHDSVKGDRRGRAIDSSRRNGYELSRGRTEFGAGIARPEARRSGSRLSRGRTAEGGRSAIASGTMCKSDFDCGCVFEGDGGWLEGMGVTHGGGEGS